MWSDGGGFRKAHKLQGAKSIGLATLLDDEQQQQQQQQNGKKVGVVVVVSASRCMQEGGSCSSNRRWGLDRTLAYVLDMSSRAPDIPFFITRDDKIDFPKVRTYLNAQLEDGIMHDSNDDGIIASSSRDGVFINASGVARPVGDNDVIVVAMDSGSASGDIRFDQSHLVLESQTVFSSARANACVWKGRWMFEATLGTAGIQQLGWATVSCPFTCEEGVGDAVDSYAYDGKRVRKWSEGPQTYGQPWVAGDVIGCCIDLDIGEISFYRNGFPLGVAYEGVRTLEPRQGYFPAISLSHSERCELNFGGRPFKYPVQGFFPIQAPPVVKLGEAQDRLGSATARAKFLLGCLQRLVQLSSHEVAAAMAPVDRLRRLIPLSEDDISSLGGEICELLQPLLLAGGLETKEEKDDATDDVRQPNQYVVWAALVPFLLETYKQEAPHDAPSVDKALDLLLPRLVDKQVADGLLISMLMEALAYGCRTSPFSFADHPYSGPYPYLALACHLLEWYDFMVLWWMSKGFDLCLEGLLTRKGPNKNDLEALMPTVWWPGSREDLCAEGKLRHAATTLSKAIDKVEELQWELFHQLLQFVPPSSGELQQQVPGVVLRRFLQHLVCKNRGANRSMAPPGHSDYSVLVSTYCVLLRLLSEGFGNGKVGAESVEGTKEHSEHSVGFLHRAGKRSFPVHLFLKDGSSTDFSRLGGTLSHLIKTYPVGLDSPKVEWVESSMDEGDELVRHGGKLQPACCSEVVMGGLGCDSKSPAQAATKIVTSSLKTGVSESAASPLSNDHNGHSCDGCEEGKPCCSGRMDIGLQGATLLRSTYKRAGFQPIMELSEAVREEELLDIMVLLYHLGLAQNFKQASFCMQHQMQSIAQLDDTDRLIRGEKVSGDYLKRLKEARTLYREDLIDFVRQCTWYV